MSERNADHIQEEMRDRKEDQINEDLEHIATRLIVTAGWMEDTASEMEYFGGFDETIRAHAKELRGAVGIARTWVKGIRGMIK